MNIKITGASGYLGKLLSSKLEENGHKVLGIKRELLYGPVENLCNEIRNSDVIINLAGSPILQRWTNSNKKKIYESRVHTSKNLIAAINQIPENERPKKFISASAIGIYASGIVHDENSVNFDDGFVGKVAEDWEGATMDLPLNIQKNIFRIGLVLGKKAKTITNLLLPFKMGLGGFVGNGKQAFPFIHEKDLINAFVWVIEEYKESGTFNLVAPEKITNKEFTKELAKQLKRPAIFPIPGFILKTIFGEAAVLLLESPVVETKKMSENGFKFKFPTINSALKDILT